MRRIATLVLTAVFFGPTVLSAQFEHGRLGIFGVLSIPQGNFADDRGNDPGFAKSGLGIGGEFNLPLNAPGLGWYSTITVILHGFDEDATGGNAGSYILAPILSGLKYEKPVSPTMDIFGIGQIGFSYVRVPSISFDDGEIEFDPASTLSFALGGGLFINSKYTVGLRLVTLGKIKADVRGATDRFRTDGAITMLFLGIRFGKQ